MNFTDRNIQNSDNRRLFSGGGVGAGGPPYSGLYEDTKPLGVPFSRIGISVKIGVYRRAMRCGAVSRGRGETSL